MDERETQHFDRARDPSDIPTIDDADNRFDADAFADPEHVGHFKILRKLGEGGFGIVYEAQQDTPIRRRVALKIIKPGMDSKAVVTRFEAERQALALMSHPNIAKVLDGGITDRGLPYFVMELVKGEPITHFCDRNKLSLPDRLKLLIPVCHAVQHAHSKSVIHRDLKPSNILVGYDSEGHPHPTVIDFGVAKALDNQLTEKTLFTTHGQMIGTPEYMSPEQAEMTGVDIDTRTDVYSLGVVLYELLTGMLPVEPQELRSKMYREMQRMIREFVPPRPSTRLGTALSAIDTKERAKSAASSRRMSDSELSRTLRGELDWIVMKCLEKDRDRRYATPTELAQELDHYLRNEPISARPPSTSYRVRKLVQRNKGAFAGITTVAAALVLATIISVRFSMIASRERDTAQRALVERDQALTETQQALALTEQRLDQIQSLIRVYSDYEERIRRIEGATAARARLADATIHVLDQIAGAIDTEDWVTHELARGYLTAAQIQSVRNDQYEDTVRAFTKARTLFMDLARDNPTDQSAMLGEAQATIGLALAQIGNADSASIRNLIAHAEELVAAISPNGAHEPVRKRTEARTLLAHANLALFDQRLDDAAAFARRVSEELRFDENTRVRDVADLDIAADARRIHAMALREQGDYAQAADQYRAVIDLRTRGVNLSPTDAVLRRGLVRDLYWLGRLTAYDLDDPEGAVEIYSRSLAHAEHLRRADPEDGLAHELIIDQRKALATALRRAGRLEEAQEQTRLLILAAEDYAASDPLDRLRQRRLFAIRFDEARVQYDDARALLRDPGTTNTGLAMLRDSVESFDQCAAFYRDLIDNDPLSTYDKFAIDAAEVELQRAKAIETLGSATDDFSVTRTAIDAYHRAADLYTIGSDDGRLSSDHLRNMSIAYRNIGTIALSIPDGPMAVEYLERADEVLPLDRWDAYARKAEAYRLINNAPTCRDYADKAFRAIESLPESRRDNARSRVQAILDALDTP